MSSARPEAGPPDVEQTHGPRQPPAGTTCLLHLSVESELRRSFIRKFRQGLLAEPGAGTGPFGEAAVAELRIHGPVDHGWVPTVDRWICCWWIKQLLYQKLIKAGFDALLAWRRQPRHDLDPSASAASVRRRPRFIDAVPGERPAVFCHLCHWVGVPRSASSPSCGNDRWHTEALSLYRDWAWQAQWNAVGRPRSWLPQWEDGEPPGPWELAAGPEDPLPPWCLGAEAPPPPPAAPVEPDEYDWS
jgi:hypothetical protein